MDDIIDIYLINKFVLSVIYNQKLIERLIIVEESSEESLFFRPEALDYVEEIIKGKNSEYILNSIKLNYLKEYLFTYITNHKKDTNLVDILDRCRSMLYTYKRSEGQINKFYKKEWEKRKIEKRDKLTLAEINIIDKSISSDYSYLNMLLDKNVNIKNLCKRNYALMSICAFISECPILIYNDIFIENVSSIISLISNNWKMFNENKNLINKIKLQIKNNLEERAKINKILKEQYIKSLIVSPVDDLVAFLSNDFDEDIFSVFSSVTQTYLDNESLSQEKINNINYILTKFTKINVDKINHIKHRLNNYKINNDKINEFYFNELVLHSSKHIFKSFTNFYDIQNNVDNLIYSDIYISNLILNLNCDITTLYNYPNLIYGINYIINKYPDIIANKIYLDRIKNILNIHSLIYNSGAIDEDIRKIFKKIKKIDK